MWRINVICTNKTSFRNRKGKAIAKNFTIDCFQKNSYLNDLDHPSETRPNFRKYNIYIKLSKSLANRRQDMFKSCIYIHLLKVKPNTKRSKRVWYCLCIF